MENKREWRPVIYYPDYYEVSDDGFVRSIRTGNVLAGWINSYGYRTVSFVVNGKRATKKVHRLVAEAFVPTIQGKPDVNHIDGDKLNNCVENLEWVTRGENNKHAATLPQNFAQRGLSVTQSTLDGEIIAIWANANTAATTLGFAQMMISACCKGTARTAYNYRWNYAGDFAEKFMKAQRLSTIRAKLEELQAQADRLEQELSRSQA